jgi:tetratricopeptide (TPR) repeat protein
LCQQGRLEEAEEAAALGEQCAAVGDIEGQVRWRQARAGVLLERSLYREAEQVIRGGMELAALTERLDLRAETLADQAIVLRQAGQHEEATQAARAALELFERKGILVLAARVRSVFSELEQ